MKKIALYCMTFCMFLIQNAYALSLSDAKNNGLVGELSNGYIAAIDKSPETEKLVDSINAKRKAKYRQISNGKNQPLHVIEKLAADKVFGKGSKGHYFKRDGKWVQK